ncbi:MAG: sigma-70 family RNA polymerase sigma factor [Saprospiraceae bacterium]|nr:sigma-70 family RNA polymerase sigma factor [Pyrinomonadaceae bacterium]
MSETAYQPREITLLLQAWSNGNRKGLDELLPLVYDELHRQAHRFLRRERQNHTLQTTALIHEAYLNLIEQNRVEWQNREHFFAISANMMRRILVNYANARQRKKRGGSAENLELDESFLIPALKTGIDLLALDEALTRLAKMDKRQEQIVELRYFSGLTIDETADVLGVSPATIKRDWKMTKAWLHRELSGKDGTRELA